MRGFMKFSLLALMLAFTDVSFGYETITLDDCTYTYEVQRYTSSTNLYIRAIEPIKSDIGIPEVIAGYKVTGIDSYVFRRKKNITSISLPSCVSYFPAEFFYQCSQLTNVTCAGIITDIRDYALAGCGFRHFEIPASVTRIGERVFSSCTNLTSVIIGNQKLGEGQFGGCSRLAEITIPQGVTKIPSGAFSSCKGLRRVEIPNSVSIIDENAFFNCHSIENIEIPESVVKIGGQAFSGCYSLKRVVLPNGVDCLSYSLFYCCSNLVEVVLPDGLKKIESFVFYNTAITEFEVPLSVTNIESSVFSSCRKLTNVTINAQLELMGHGLLSGCSALEKVELPETLKNIEYSTFSGCESLPNVEIPVGVTNIARSAFENCLMLSKIVIPETVVSIGAEAFRNSGLKDTLVIPDGVKRIGHYAFDECPYTNVILGAGIEYVGGYSGAGATSPFSSDFGDYRLEVHCRPPAGIMPTGSSAHYAIPEELAFSWRNWLMENEIDNMVIIRDYPVVKILSAQMRRESPSIMDIEYRVESADYSSVNVRVLAYTGGTRSLTNLILPKTFVEGTSANVGDAVPVNRNHRLSWCVAADTEFSAENLRFEILVERNGGLPLELIDIPGVGEVSVAYPPSKKEIFDALLWRYADGTGGLTLQDRFNSSERWKELAANGKVLARKSGISGNDYAITYLYGLMGYDVLNSAQVTSALRSPRPHIPGSVNHWLRYPIKAAANPIGQDASANVVVSAEDEDEPVFVEVSYVCDMDGKTEVWAGDYLDVGGVGKTYDPSEMVAYREEKYIFTHWSCNGAQELTFRDSWGRSLEEVDYMVEEGLVLTAHFKPMDKDVDKDGVPDGYELYWYGNLNANASTDSDGDGVGFLREIEMESNPLFAEYYNGGFTRTACTEAIAYARAEAEYAIVSVKDPTTGHVATNMLPIAQALDVANKSGGYVAISGLMPSSLEVSPGVTVAVDGFSLSKEELSDKVVIKPIDPVQDVKFFQIMKDEVESGGTVFKVAFDDEAIEMPQISKDVLSAIMGKCDTELHIANAKEGLYYGVVFSEQIDKLDVDVDKLTFCRAGAEGVVLMLPKVAGNNGFVKIIVRDRP